MKKKIFALSVLISIALLIGSSSSFVTGFAEPEGRPALAPVGTAFTYQGHLVDNGSPASGTYDFQFELFDALSGGSQAGGTVTKDDVAVSEGRFTVELDFGSFFDGTALWLAVGVRPGASTGSFTDLIPRQALTAVPYAITALNFPTHDHFGESWSGTGTGLSLASTDTTGFVNGLWAESASDGGNGIYGYATSTTGPAWGVVGESEADEGVGVFGSANSPSGTTFGVWGQTASTTDYASGVYGFASALSGNTRGVLGVSDSDVGEGVFGSARSTTGLTTGVYGRSDSVEGAGVVGWASATTGLTKGVVGMTDSSSDFSSGIYGSNSSLTGFTSGVYGESASADGVGVIGYSYSATGSTYGVQGQANSPDGIGIWGYASSNATSGFPVGVLGENHSTTGWGVYASGDLGASGNLYVYGGTKSAVVQTKDFGLRELYAVESSEVWFEDFGTAILSNGIKTVTFEQVFLQTVNFAEDYHVFLTPLGDCGLFVSEKTEMGFTVNAIGGSLCEISFDYRIVAKRIGFEEIRLKAASAPVDIERNADALMTSPKVSHEMSPEIEMIK